jgi:hypothetical protein
MIDVSIIVIDYVWCWRRHAHAGARDRRRGFPPTERHGGDGGPALLPGAHRCARTSLIDPSLTLFPLFVLSSSLCLSLCSVSPSLSLSLALLLSRSLCLALLLSRSRSLCSLPPWPLCLALSIALLSPLSLLLLRAVCHASCHASATACRSCSRSAHRVSVWMNGWTYCRLQTRDETSSDDQLPAAALPRLRGEVPRRCVRDSCVARGGWEPVLACHVMSCLVMSCHIMSRVSSIKFYCVVRCELDHRSHGCSARCLRCLASPLLIVVF